MSEYIDLVLCKHPSENKHCKEKSYLFQAPNWSHLKPFEDVIVDTRKGEQPAKVINSITVKKDSDEFKFIVGMAGATLPLRKVKSRVVRVEMEFMDEEENENGTDQTGE